MSPFGGKPNKPFRVAGQPLQEAQTVLSERRSNLHRQHRHSRSRARHIQMDDIVFLSENFSRLSAGSVISVEEPNSLSRKRTLHLGCLCNPYGLRKHPVLDAKTTVIDLFPIPFRIREETMQVFGQTIRLAVTALTGGKSRPSGLRSHAYRFWIKTLRLWSATRLGGFSRPYGRR